MENPKSNLPEEMLRKADISGSEEGWKISDFPEVLRTACTHKLACIGGQFQFRGPIGIAEMYWLNADSSPKKNEERWEEYVQRANDEVLRAFNFLIEKTDFHAEAKKWDHINNAIKGGKILDPLDHLFFVAYFNDESKTGKDAPPR